MTTSYTNYVGVSIFSPDGKVNTLSHIDKSVSLGSTVVAITNHRQCIFLAHHQHMPLQYRERKIFVHPHMLYTFSGITNDGLEIHSHLLDEMTAEQVWKNRTADPVRVMDRMCVLAASRTMISSDRLFGCAAVIGVQHDGRIKVVEWLPTGVVRPAMAVALGGRAQSCKTVLEKHFKDHDQLADGDMLPLAIDAMKNAHGEDRGMSVDNLEAYVLALDEVARPVADIAEYLR